MAGNAITALGDGSLNLTGAGPAQPLPPIPDNVVNAPIDVMTSPEFWLSVVLLGFGLIVIGVQLYLAMRRDANGAPSVSIEAGIRLSIVSLIIVGALVLIASGYSNNQIAPAMGLFGTIAGYLIGKQDRST